MADYADIASTLSEQDLDIALANIKHFDQPSFHECEDCGETIPQQRRKIGGGNSLYRLPIYFRSQTETFKGLKNEN